MAEYRVNPDGVAKARAMIDANQYDLETAWEDGQPSADEGTAFIDRHGYQEFGEWHLAIDVNASEETKDRYGFVYGDFRRVFRSGLIAAKSRAAQFDHDDIADAADELLELLDETRSG